ncbi:MAG: FAD-dependent oxidoreductase [Oscillospiraceae bacterium]|nr:FAD-dependent oxidoreductase [Oscillospiraceae bacterium]
MYKSKYPNLFKPLKIRNLVMKNRIMSAPNMLFHTIGGRPDNFYISYLEHKARGGCGIVTLGEANVCDGGNHTPGMETTLENMAIYAEMAQAIHEHGAIASVELTHGGQGAKTQFNIDPNMIMGPCETVNPMTGAKVRAMTADDMEHVATAFADAAAYYIHAGFDTVLVHCAHGWLLTQFLSPIINKRTDEYGGSLENRMRFPLQVLKKIRERLGENRAILIRLSGSEREPSGFTTDDIAVFLSKAQEYVDMAEISTEGFGTIFATPFVERGQNVPLAEALKKSGLVKIPLFTVGSILGPAQAEEIIASRKADGVSMSRALIADPFLPKKAALGAEDDITPCLRCMNCTGSDNARRHLICSVNPLIAREARLGFGDTAIKPARVAKKVLVVGGGPAGMQAAITASERGHDVTLVERGEALGGYLRFVEKDSHKSELKQLLAFLIRKANRSGAKILLNTAATDELIEKITPDNIIVATGGRPIVPGIKGIENAHHAAEVYLNGELSIGKDVVIIGGGLTGLETGLHLASQGKQVTVLELEESIVKDTMDLYTMSVMDAAGKHGLTVITGAKTLEITDCNVTYEQDGKRQTLMADTILHAIGMRQCAQVYLDLHDKAPFVALIGDAKAPGKVDGAIHGGFFAALEV